MIWMLILLTGTAFAQVDLSAIQELDEELPNFTDFKQSDEEININRIVTASKSFSTKEFPGRHLS